jgi:hypothetical protein
MKEPRCKRCKRPHCVLSWKIKKDYYCQRCFDYVFEHTEVDIEKVIRLSNNPFAFEGLHGNSKAAKPSFVTVRAAAAVRG